MSCDVEIAFAPKLNQDIFAHIHILTETGPLDIPLTCLIKRCAPRLAETFIDLGQLFIGQNLEHTLVIRNSQALSSPYEIHELRDDGQEISGEGAAGTEEESEEVGIPPSADDGENLQSSPRAPAFTIADLEGVDEASNDPGSRSLASSEEVSTFVRLKSRHLMCALCSCYGRE